MLCQKCGRFDAIVHREMMVFRQKVEEHLCPMCAGTGLPPNAFGNSRGLGKKLFDPVLVPHGLTAVPNYVEMMLSTVGSGHGALLVVGKPPDRILMVLQSTRRAQVRFFVGQPAELEENIRAYFGEQSAAPVESTARVLCYALPTGAEEAARLIIGCLVRCFHITDADVLTFTLA